MSDGGPAFAAPQFAVPGNLSEDKILLLKSTQGMSLRDYFAAKAMARINQEYGFGDLSMASEACYKWADAMLEARKK